MWLSSPVPEMSTNRKTQTDAKSTSGFSRLEKVHPYKTFLFFSLVGSTILFLSMAFLYFLTLSRSGLPPGFHLPKAFSVSTVFLLLNSFCLSHTLKGYKNDSIRQIKQSLYGTLALGFIFCVAQITGWMQLSNSGFFLNTNVGIAYLYVITGLHFLHVAGGMIYLVFLTHNISQVSGDVVKTLLFYTDSFQYTRLQLTSIYWHFVDVLWILLFFMFLFAF